VGGGTAMVGDPSGKTDMRRMMTVETVEQNALTIKRQLSRFLDFSAGKAMMVNNADWLLNLNYLEFIRDIGAHFSVNRMLAADCYKQRYESGLTFLEFNYMPMQSYDFLMLFKKHNCRLQMGGDDQWSNMLSGADLIRRKEREAAFACTFKLLLNSEGVKMGKTEKGALWLDSDMCSPYDFYQYWRNVSDSDVEKCLGLLTFLPMDEVRRLSALEGSQINEAKKVLAFECTALVHGKEEAQKAQLASAALFDNTGESLEDVPTFVVTDQILEEDNRLTSLLYLCGLCVSRTEARKMVGQGAVQVDGDKATDVEMRILRDALDKTDGLLLRKGKKSYCRLILQ
jgi:tyrosyl-tRNA synthetase